MTKDVHYSEEMASNAAKEILEVAKIEALKLISQAQAQAQIKVDQPIGVIAVVANDISHIKQDIFEIKEKLEHKYIAKEEFAPVRNIVYGLVGILGVATVGALLNLLIK